MEEKKSADFPFILLDKVFSFFEWDNAICELLFNFIIYKED